MLKRIEVIVAVILASVVSAIAATATNNNYWMNECKRRGYIVRDIADHQLKWLDEVEVQR